MSLSLACFIGLATFDPHGENKGWPTFNIILSISILFFILIIPVVLYRIIKLNHDKLKEDTFLIKYSSLYDCLEYSKPHSLLYVLMLFIKRLTVAFTLAILRSSFLLQFFLVTSISQAALAYYIICKPFSTTYLNRMEIVNEVTLLACLYTCLLFTDYQPSETVIVDKPRVGWVFIIIVLINLGINFAGILSMVAKVSIVIYRKAKEKYRILKRLWEEYSHKEGVVPIEPIKDSENMVD